MRMLVAMVARSSGMATPFSVGFRYGAGEALAAVGGAVKTGLEGRVWEREIGLDALGERSGGRRRGKGGGSGRRGGGR